jgi:hypothetical protein
VMLTVVEVASGSAGTANPRLTEPVAMFAMLAGAAWAAGRLSGVAGAAAYRIASLVAVVLTYGVLGFRLGFHPWHDSAFYTLPAGAVLVAAGVVAARRGLPGAAPMHWLGSVLAAAPMLLHALDDRFVTVRPSFGYDAATIGVALALGAVGVLCQLKGPSVVGAVALGTDLFVVAFSQIRWSEIPMAIYAIGVGSTLFLSSWALIYRREQLERFRVALRGRRDAFERWR